MKYKTLNVESLTDAEIADIEAHIKGKQDGPDTYPSPKRGWTCFHCGSTFYTQFGARLHFGKRPNEVPACWKEPI